VGPRGGLGAVVKKKIPSLYRDLNPQPVAKRCATELLLFFFFFFLLLYSSSSSSFNAEFISVTIIPVGFRFKSMTQVMEGRIYVNIW